MDDCAVAQGAHRTEFQCAKVDPTHGISKAWYFHRKQAISRPKTADGPAPPGALMHFKRKSGREPG
jgi:hypothetical protein